MLVKIVGKSEVYEIEGPSNEENPGDRILLRSIENASLKNIYSNQLEWVEGVISEITTLKIIKQIKKYLEDYIKKIDFFSRYPQAKNLPALDGSCWILNVHGKWVRDNRAYVSWGSPQYSIPIDGCGEMVYTLKMWDWVPASYLHYLRLSDGRPILVTYLFE